MLNHGPHSQAAVAAPEILAAIEPLLGDDCHVIANTAWRNPPEFGGGPWHCDAGPHVPRPKGVDWDDRIPYPVFAIGAHLLAEGLCGRRRTDRRGAGQSSFRAARTGVADRGPRPHLRRSPHRSSSKVGPATSHCSCPTSGIAAPRPTSGSGRLFLQVHYGRREHRAANSHDRCRQPAGTRSDRAGGDPSPARPRGTPRAVLLRRLTARRRGLRWRDGHWNLRRRQRTWWVGRNHRRRRGGRRRRLRLVSGCRNSFRARRR